MNVTDINQHLKIPDGYKITGLSGDGSYLKIECRRLRDDSVSVVTIFLNDMGREVIRSEEEIDPLAWPGPPRVLSYGDVRWWDKWIVRFQLFILELQEAVCHKK